MKISHSDPIRRFDGSIDTDFYVRRAAVLREVRRRSLVVGLVARLRSVLGRLPEVARMMRTI